MPSTPLSDYSADNLRFGHITVKSVEGLHVTCLVVLSVQFVFLQCNKTSNATGIFIQGSRDSTIGTTKQVSEL